MGSLWTIPISNRKVRIEKKGCKNLEENIELANYYTGSIYGMDREPQTHWPKLTRCRPMGVQDHCHSRREKKSIATF